MQTALQPLRTSCRAQNAYNSIIALTSVLGRALGSENVPGRKSFASATLANALTWRSRRKHGPQRRFSTANGRIRKAAAPAERRGIDIHAILQADARRLDIKKEKRASVGGEAARARLEEHGKQLGQGATFENYDALMNDLGQPPPPNAQEKPTRVGKNITEPSRSSNKATATSRREKRFSSEGRLTPGKPVADTGSGPTEDGASSASVNNSERNVIAQDRWQVSVRRLWTDINKALADARLPSSPSDMKVVAENLDYNGAYVDAARSPRRYTRPAPWTLTPSQVKSLSPDQFLEKEIERFVAYMEPTPAERVAREAVSSDLMARINQLCDPKVVGGEIFGSSRTGLILPTSDIDIRIALNDSHAKFSKTPLIPVMESIYRALNGGDDYICTVYRHSRFPIINTQHKATGLDVQIVAAPSTKPQHEIMLRYLREIPNLRTLYILIHTMIGTRGLTDFYYGGTGSYGLFLMLVASLQRRQTNPPTDLRNQLYQFFNFYSEIDTTKHGISVSPPKLFKKHDAETPVEEHAAAAQRRGDAVRAGQWRMSRCSPVQPYLLCLQDPSNPSNDLGSKGGAIKHLLATLRRLRADLESAEKRSYAARGERRTILESLVGAVHEVHFQRRRKLEGFGEGLLAEEKAEEEVA